MYRAARPLLFRLDPERAHAVALRYLERLHRSGWTSGRVLNERAAADPRLRLSWLGSMLPGPLGVAAGFDKGATCYNGLFRLGFAHVEVGTFTPRAHEGNEPPRIERLPGSHALVNRLGFNNPGVEVAAGRLASIVPAGFVAANVGPNRDAIGEDARAALAAAGVALAPHVAALTLNVSSPNAPGLRELQRPQGLGALVQGVLERLDGEGAQRPLLVKLHPDAPDEEIVAAGRAAMDAGASGLVAVNTTTRVPTEVRASIQGGLSGRPLRDRAETVCALLSKGLGSDVPIMGVGGVSTGVDVLRRMAVGAHAVQAYTGFVYRGPRFPRAVNREVLAGLDRLGVDRLDEVVGLGLDVVSRKISEP